MSAPDWGIEVENCDVFDGLSPEKQAQVLQMATDFLWLWTGRAFGTETVEVRPCKANHLSREGAFPNGPAVGYTHGKMLPVLIGGQWTNIGCGRCGDECGCDNTPALRLPGPVASIEEVLVDGEVLPPTAYRVDDARYLVRIDGGTWPTCQDMAAPVTAPGTWQVTYTRGVPVPAGGLLAGSLLACEFAKAIAAPKSCALPQRIQQVTRQSVTVTLMDDFTTLKEGGTGIYLIDSWVASVTKPRHLSSVRSPDIPRPRFRRTTWGG